MFCAGISARTRIRTHILCTHTHFQTFPAAKSCKLDLLGANMAGFLNFPHDGDISVDFFCDPSAQMSKSFMTVTVSLPGTFMMLMQQQMVRHLVMALASGKDLDDDISVCVACSMVLV